MYMRFGNILNELLYEWYGEDRNPFKTDDLILSVADDSKDYFVMVVNSIKFNRIIGTFTITLTSKPFVDGETVKEKKDALMIHKFEKVPNKEVMLQALGKIPEALSIYMETFESVYDAPDYISFEPNTPVEARFFGSRDFEQLIWNHLRSSDSPHNNLHFRENYYMVRTDKNGYGWKKRWYN